ncbi:MAG TPA: glycerol kinase GlpK [Steroidobacteraceae bacterium]|nr:glycerol kinase GlpK [Steroidobacteraceae bacterium]
MPDYVLALDQGTTSSRSILFAHDGTSVAVAQREFRQHFPRPGWVEHDAEDIWSSQSATIADVLTRASASPDQIAAVGITNQRETTLLWDRRTGRAVCPAIVWQDRRTADMCARLRADGVEPQIARHTGLLLDPYFSGTKLAWMLENVPDARARAANGELAFGTVDSWLIWRLTGGRMHVTDVTNASRTLLCNVTTGEWDDAMLELFGVPRACLPQIVPSSIDTSSGREVPIAHLAGGQAPITGIAGDQQAALFGQACFAPGMAKNTYGTGCFLLLNTGHTPIASQHRLLTTIAWQRGVERYYAMEGAVFIAGAVVQWLRDGLGLIERADQVEALARSVPDSGGVVFVPAFTGLGSPHWDAHARGMIIGLSRGTTGAHLARAALEAIAFQSAELIAAMQADTGQELLELRVDGGAAANDLLMQIQADLLGVPVVRPAMIETTALGAAYLAGLASGFWRSEQEVADNWRVGRRFEPALDRDQANERLDQWSRAVARSRAWTED